MDSQLESIRDQQKENWNKFSAGWKKWNAFAMDFLKPMGDAIIEELDIRENDTVLDIASGTGEPAMTIAALAKKGKVYATDVSDQMLDIARANATVQKLDNLQCKVCDASELPFEDQFFDKISCRMGFMFFPDTQLAANEIYRVCKRGGRIATSVWAGPELNPWITSVMAILSKYTEIPAPLPDSPGMFRCATPGYIKGIFENAGFKENRERTVTGKVTYDSPAHYWQIMNEMSGAVIGALSTADDAIRQQVKKEVFESLKNSVTGGKLALDYASVIVSGEK